MTEDEIAAEKERQRIEKEQKAKEKADKEREEAKAREEAELKAKQERAERDRLLKESDAWLSENDAIYREFKERMGRFKSYGVSATIDSIIGWDAQAHRVIAKGIDGELYSGNPELVAELANDPYLTGEPWRCPCEKLSR